MDTTFFDMSDKKVYGTRQFVRWVQPPQITYFINSLDKEGNHNVSTVTMGTAMIQGDGFYFPFAINHFDFAPKDSLSNLSEVSECVISYVGRGMLHESWIAALPIPKGINEADICNFHMLPSKKVRPAGIAECPINLECKIIQTIDTGCSTKIFLAKVVGVTVHKDLVELHEKSELATGILNIDPIFEIVIDTLEDGRPPRLFYAALNRESLLATSDEIGNTKRWGGSFGEWMDSELERGRIAGDEHDEIMALYTAWDKDKNPCTNAKAKELLTKKLKEIVWRPRDSWPGTGRA